MNLINDYRISKTFKYLALYPRLGFFEENELEHFTKTYKSGYIVDIFTTNQSVDFHNGVNVINGEFKLNNAKSFVILEVVNKLLDMGYSEHLITIDLHNEFDVYCGNLYIRCFDWDRELPRTNLNKSTKYYDINYQSRLMSGLIERRYFASINSVIGNNGIFELDTCKSLYDIKECDEILNKFESSQFWDRQDLQEFTIEDNITNIGGDTFYNCANLKRLVIGKNVKEMGNNPFAGCPELELINESPYFIYENDALYNKDKTILIYFNVKSNLERFEIPSTVKMVGKHAFYLSKLKEIVIPHSVKKLENNPFSGCKNVHLINHSTNYDVIDDIIYTSDHKTVIGALNSIKTDCLILKDIESISRNSFWNCKGIQKIVFPKTLKEIGYNPFVGCSNIEFESYSENYKVVDGVLYNKDLTKIVCYPSNLAIGDVHIPDSVTTLERGAFSGCDKMTSIHLHNVNIISKSCFTNCTGLTNVYLSDLITYVGEWAFGHCTNLKEVSMFKDTFVDNHAFLNTKANIIKREKRDNMIIESENIHTLKSLLKSYKEKIDFITIDPPYNSNISYINYVDSYKRYYNFILDRVKVSYELLSKNGIMSLNIDKGEKNTIVKIFKEVFKHGKVTVHKWKKLHPFFDKNRDTPKNKKKVTYEYIIIGRKNKDSKFNKVKQPYIKHGVLLEKEANFPKIFDCFGTNSSAKDEIKAIFGDRKYFSTPKPVKLIKELVRGCSHRNSIIMDFFAGSGTLGQAVEELNKEDNGNRKYIMISNNENDICKKVTKERMNKIGSKFIFLD